MGSGPSWRGNVFGLVRFHYILPLKAKSGFLLTYGRAGIAPYFVIFNYKMGTAMHAQCKVNLSPTSDSQLPSPMVANIVFPTKYAYT